MRNLIIGLVTGSLIGSVVGFTAGLFIFPFLFPPPPLSEQVVNKSPDAVLGNGTFIHANPLDPVHYGKGRVTLYQDLLHLESDFRVGPGPKYHVYLVPEANITSATRVQDTMFIDLGRLKAFSGSQNYSVPAGVTLKDYRSVVIWCEQFNVLISPAQINFTAK
jgi:hypothetical protein